MTYSATILQLLLSSPSDLPPEHKEVVIKAIRVWNNSHGRRLGIHFSPTNWEEGSTPAFGEGPQAILNKQVVDTSDIGLVIFTDRLGTPTPTHGSGTVEEIERLHERGKRVAILRNRSPRRSASGTDAAKQALALEEYLGSIQDRALYREYESLDDLLGAVSLLLTNEASEFVPTESAGATLAEREENDLAKGVWPGVEVERSVEVDSRGRPKERTRRYLVLTNDTGVPVTDVSFVYEEPEEEGAHPFDIRPQDHQPVRIMGPGTSQRFPVMQVWGSADSAVCVVSWTDPNGNTRQTRATVVAH